MSLKNKGNCKEVDELLCLDSTKGSAKAINILKNIKQAIHKIRIHLLHKKGCISDISDRDLHISSSLSKALLTKPNELDRQLNKYQRDLEPENNIICSKIRNNKIILVISDLKKLPLTLRKNTTL